LEKLEPGETLLHFDRRQSSFGVLNYFTLIMGAAIIFLLYDVLDGGALFLLIFLFGVLPVYHAYHCIFLSKRSYYFVTDKRLCIRDKTTFLAKPRIYLDIPMSDIQRVKMFSSKELRYVQVWAKEGVKIFKKKGKYQLYPSHESRMEEVIQAVLDDMAAVDVTAKPTIIGEWKYLDDLQRQDRTAPVRSSAEHSKAEMELTQLIQREYLRNGETLVCSSMRRSSRWRRDFAVELGTLCLFFFLALTYGIGLTNYLIGWFIFSFIAGIIVFRGYWKYFREYRLRHEFYFLTDKRLVIGNRESKDTRDIPYDTIQKVSIPRINDMLIRRWELSIEVKHSENEEKPARLLPNDLQLLYETLVYYT